MPERDSTLGGDPGTNPHRSGASVADAFDPPQAAGEIGRFGKYRVLKRLGEGGMGEVFAAEHAHLPGHQYALKFLLPQFAAVADNRRRFLAEAQAAARVKHAHVVAIHDVDELRGVPFIAMERLRGRPLNTYLEQHGTPTVGQTLRVVWEAADGLAAAHAAGLVHRDIKPANLWLAAPDGTVKVIDFGLAADTLRNTRHTQAGAMMGTPAYMAPEQIDDAKGVDARADLFSLGVVLYEVLTGVSPFLRDSLRATLAAILVIDPPPPWRQKPDLPPGLSELVMRLLAKDREQRAPSAQAVAAELRGIRRAMDRQSPAIVTPPKASRPARWADVIPAPLFAPFGEAVAKRAQAAYSSRYELPRSVVVELPGGVKLNLVLIPPGSFTMGSPKGETNRNESEVEHLVSIRQPFYLGKFAITQEQYQAVAGESPSHFQGKRVPVHLVSHDDAEAFCKKVVFRGGRVLLPSEAQWEYACRAGTATPFHFGHVLDGTQAHCDGQQPYGTTKQGRYASGPCDVGRYPANAWGLCDMHGNMWEWCADWYGPYSAVKDPEYGQMQKPENASRVLRGGCWVAPAWNCRAAHRLGSEPDQRSLNCGFRVAVRLD